MNKQYCASKAAMKAGFNQAVNQFGRREDGGILPFTLTTIMLMLLIMGLAVDVMRAEHKRTKIQYTQDRAVLAAANLKQNLSPQAIIDDYFLKEGLQDVTPTAVVVDALNLRRVTAEYADGNMPTINTLFLDVLGVDTLSAPAIATAEDGIGKVEISLVLDVSGSMGGDSVSGDTKIEDLKTAAKDFVVSLLDDDSAPNTYSISIVPYSTQVTAGQSLLDNYNVSSEHDSSHCVDFASSDFNSASISTSTLLQRSGHFAPWTWSYRLPIGWWSRNCVTDDISGRKILPLSGDTTELTDYIDDLEASGWTSTEVGIKWGTALLDPSAQTVVSNLVISGEIASGFDGRPYNYNENSTRKVMVVMTDGENTNQYFLDPSVASGLSNVWHKDVSSNDDREKFWVYNPARSGAKKYRKLFYENQGYDNDEDVQNYVWDLFKDAKWVKQPANTANRLTYQELWDLVSMRFVSHKLYGPAGLGYTWDSDGWENHFSRVGWDEKDVRMAGICTAAKANNILLYTIGFEVGDDNAVKLASCATTPAHFFRVEGVEISEAFASIAAQISNLKLIQ